MAGSCARVLMRPNPLSAEQGSGALLDHVSAAQAMSQMTYASTDNVPPFGATSAGARCVALEGVRADIA